MGGGVGGVGGGGPVYFNPTGDPDPKQQAYAISGDLVQLAKDRVGIQGTINSLNLEINDLDNQIAIARTRGDFKQEMSLIMKKSEVSKELRGKELDLSACDEKISQKIETLIFDVYPNLNKADQDTIKDIKHIFDHPDKMNTETIDKLEEFHKNLNPNP